MLPEVRAVRVFMLLTAGVRLSAIAMMPSMRVIIKKWTSRHAKTSFVQYRLCLSGFVINYPQAYAVSLGQVATTYIIQYCTCLLYIFPKPTQGRSVPSTDFSCSFFEDCLKNMNIKA